MMLSPIFFCEDPIDLEHKQYVLLSYLQKLDKMFKEEDLNGYEELKYHSKNVESYLTTRMLLESEKYIKPSKSDKSKFNEATKYPDDDKNIKEIHKICDWALPKLHEKEKEGGIIFKKIESILNLYFIGSITKKDSGFLLIRYAGADITESYKLNYDDRTKKIVIKFYKLYDMPSKKDFGDVKLEILREENVLDDMFVAVDGNLSYNSMKSTIPVLKNILYNSIFNRNSSSYLRLGPEKY